MEHIEGGGARQTSAAVSLALEALRRGQRKESCRVAEPRRGLPPSLSKVGRDPAHLPGPDTLAQSWQGVSFLMGSTFPGRRPEREPVTVPKYIQHCSRPSALPWGSPFCLQRLMRTPVTCAFMAFSMTSLSSLPTPPIFGAGDQSPGAGREGEPCESTLYEPQCCVLVVLNPCPKSLGENNTFSQLGASAAAAAAATAGAAFAGASELPKPVSGEFVDSEQIP